MKTFISHYSLNKKISGGSHQSTEGVLFKFEFDDESIGYSLYQPILSVGDRPIQEIKQSFLKPTITDATCLRIVEASKKLSHFLSDSSSFIKNPVSCYFSGGAAVEFDEETLNNQVLAHGFKTVKLKVSELAMVNFDLFIKNNIKLILDFNQKGNSLELEKILKDESKAGVILYLEDPPSFINHSNTKVAQDFDMGLKTAEYVVSKPTGFERQRAPLKGRSEIVTSYLDHPVGQVISALSVGKSSFGFEHGLKTSRFYEENDYSRLFSPLNQFSFDFKDELINLLEKERWVLI